MYSVIIKDSFLTPNPTIIEILNNHKMKKIYFSETCRQIFFLAISGIIGVVTGLGWGIATEDSMYNITSYESLDFYDEEFARLTHKPDDNGNNKIMSGENKEIADYKNGTLQTSIPSSYHRIISSTSKKYRIEPSLVYAVIQVESNWNSQAVSRRGAIGLMQLMPATAQDMNITNPFNPEENIEGGVRYLRYLLDRFNGELSLTLAAYNAGPGKIEKHRGIPPITETQKYVKRVLSLYHDKHSGSKKLNSKI